MKTVTHIAKALYAQMNTPTGLNIKSPNFKTPQVNGQPALLITQDTTGPLTNRTITLTCDDPNTLALAEHILDTKTLSYTDMITAEDVYPEEMENGTYTAKDFPAFSTTTIHLAKHRAQTPNTRSYDIIALSS